MVGFRSICGRFGVSMINFKNSFKVGLGSNTGRIKVSSAHLQ